MSLEKELEGVTISGDVSPDDSTNDVDTTGAQAADDDAADGQSAQAGDGGIADPDKPGRSSENVRRELLRKLDESNKENRALIAQVSDMIRALGSAAPARKEAQTYDDLTIDDLRTLASKVPADQKQAFDAYFNERLVSDTVNKHVSQITKKQKYDDEKKRMTKLAVDKYPQLMDRFHPLAVEVNRRLVSTDPRAVEFNTRIVLNLADEAASELGIAPRTVSHSRSVSQLPSTRINGKPVTRTESGENVIASDEEYEKIARKLASALKRSRSDPKTRKERILGRGKEYAQYLKGKE